MLTSFFGKSNPVNFVLVGSYMLLVGLGHFLLGDRGAFSFLDLGMLLGVITGLIFSMLILDFVIRKNAITLLNTFGVFLFSCAVGMIPSVYFEPEVVVANLFILLAVRRIFSLQSSKNTEAKILDASLWIGIASLFYFWSILLLLVLFAAIFLMPQKSFRHYLIPFVGWVGLLLIVSAYQLVMTQTFGWWSEWWTPISFDFSSYASWKLWVVITLLLVLLVWSLASKLADISSGPRKERPTKVVQLFLVVATFLMVLVSAEKNGAELLFLLAPFSMMVAAYVQKPNDRWFKELILWCFVLAPIVFLAT
ncbi:MAG: DUF6427 family protein [Bacteroidota bacterium]